MNNTITATLTKINNIGLFLNQDHVENEDNPISHLNHFCRKYPKIFKTIYRKVIPQLRAVSYWPNYCYLPTPLCNIILEAHKENMGVERSGSDGEILGALSSWFYTQGIYKFIPEVYDEIISTKCKGNIPVDAVKRLPQHSIYIETPKHSAMYGFFAHLDFDEESDKSQLRFLLNTPNGLIPVALNLGNWTIFDALKDYIIDVTSNFDKQDNNINEDYIEEELVPISAQCLSLVLYLCCEEPDIETINDELPIRAKPTKTKKGFVLHPPKKPKVWHVGKNISEQIKLINDYQNGKHNSPIAHIRKAHWHGVRTGKRGSVEEKLHYKWWPATLINGKKAA